MTPPGGRSDACAVGSFGVFGESRSVGEVEQVEADLVGEAALCRAVDDGNDHLAGGADDGAVEVAAEYAALFVADAHVQVSVERAVPGGDGAGQRDDLKIAAEAVGQVFFFFGFENADGEIAYCADGADRGQADVLGSADGGELFEYFFAAVDAGDDMVGKTLILHGEYSFVGGYLVDRMLLLWHGAAVNASFWFF